ncbi:hypothetical protein MsAc7_11950 [Methanolapillus millepedarum]|uniref:Uncharacterized protein n=2 Tax=Methanolapillus millepedarum TaxID=3028296 RepID=A0AA97A499_9EURY|nr:hypothetical protein MsAc7_11950 [Methanosarcinaceae archaeon Ac7]
MKKRFEKHGYVREFNEYYELNISPIHVHKSKEEHKQAIFVLSSALAVVAEEQSGVYAAEKTSRQQRNIEKDGFEYREIDDIFDDRHSQKNNVVHRNDNKSSNKSSNKNDNTDDRRENGNIKNGRNKSEVGPEKQW